MPDPLVSPGVVAELGLTPQEHAEMQANAAIAAGDFALNTAAQSLLAIPAGLAGGITRAMGGNIHEAASDVERVQQFWSDELGLGLKTPGAKRLEEDLAKGVLAVEDAVVDPVVTSGVPGAPVVGAMLATIANVAGPGKGKRVKGKRKALADPEDQMRELEDFEFTQEQLGITDAELRPPVEPVGSRISVPTDEILALERHTFANNRFDEQRTNPLDTAPRELTQEGRIGQAVLGNPDAPFFDANEPLAPFVQDAFDVPREVTVTPGIEGPTPAQVARLDAETGMRTSDRLRLARDTENPIFQGSTGFVQRPGRRGTPSELEVRHEDTGEVLREIRGQFFFPDDPVNAALYAKTRAVHPTQVPRIREMLRNFTPEQLGATRGFPKQLLGMDAQRQNDILTAIERTPPERPNDVRPSTTLPGSLQTLFTPERRFLDMSDVNSTGSLDNARQEFAALQREAGGDDPARTLFGLDIDANFRQDNQTRPLEFSSARFAPFMQLADRVGADHLRIRNVEDTSNAQDQLILFEQAIRRLSDQSALADPAGLEQNVRGPFRGVDVLRGLAPVAAAAGLFGLQEEPNEVAR